MITNSDDYKLHETKNDKALEWETLKRFAAHAQCERIVRNEERSSCDARLYRGNFLVCLVEVTCRKVPWGTYQTICGRDKKKTDALFIAARQARCPVYLVTRWRGGRIFYIELTLQNLHFACTWPMKPTHRNDTPDVCYFFPAHLFVEVKK